MTPPGNSWSQRLMAVATRVAVIMLIAFVVGLTLNRIEAVLKRNAQPAGFGRGVIQGALMPMSMPNLIVGHDITIYSLNNTGISYKLGYTAGVNGCGALFFGLTFWRFSRWRASGRASSNTAANEQKKFGAGGGPESLEN
jgi:hypothetical protein